MADSAAGSTAADSAAVVDLAWLSPAGAAQQKGGDQPPFLFLRGECSLRRSSVESNRPRRTQRGLTITA
jgi:hypothetical protein